MVSEAGRETPLKRECHNNMTDTHHSKCICEMGIINNPSMQCPYAAIVSVNLGRGADAESAIF